MKMELFLTSFKKRFVSSRVPIYIEYFLKFSKYREDGKTYRETVMLLSEESKISSTTIKKAIRTIRNTQLKRQLILIKMAKKPSEIPEREDPTVIPPEEPIEPTQPIREPEIKPEVEPATPFSPPKEIPPPLESD